MPSKYLLVIATSGRMLAKKLDQLGFKPLVIDIFADQDTCQYACDIRKVQSLAVKEISLAIHELQQLYTINDVVYGSGFEKQVSSLFFLQKQLNLFGNTPEVFKKTQDKPALFEILNKHNFRFPEVSFSRPESGVWLFKPCYSEGGLGIFEDKFEGGSFQQGYWQQYQSGEVMSVVFIADGKHADIMGFNRQWSINLGKGQEYVFSGVCNQARVIQNIQQKIAEWVAVLTAQFELKGLNGIDFIVHQDECYFLEINPRPIASVELYPADLVAAHLGMSSKINSNQKRCQGYQVIYAKADCWIPEQIKWPQWLQDRPKCNTIIYKYQPLCSIIASGVNSDQVLSELAARQKIVENIFQKET